MRRISTVATVFLALALSACSDSDDGDDSDSDSSKSSPSSSATASPANGEGSEEADVADQAIVDAAVLTIKDMPSGWTSAAPEDDDEDEDEEGKTEIAECVGVEYDDLYNDAHATANSDDFTSPGDEEISVEVGLANTEEWMVSAFDVFGGAKFRECARDLLEEGLEEEDDVEVGEVSLNEMSFDQLGDGTTAFRVSVPVSADGVELEVISDFVAVRVGRGQVVLSSLAYGSPMDTDDLAGFAKISVDRLQAGLATS